MRNLITVIDAMLEHIPRSEESTRTSLEDIKSSVAFAAPEAMKMWWNETANILVEEVGEPDCQWKETIARIFSGQE